MNIQGYNIKDIFIENDREIIYNATLTDSKKDVHLKILNLECATNINILNYEREYRVVSLLNNNFFIDIYEFKRFNNTAYIAYEKINGKKLKDVIYEKNYSVKDLLNITLKLAKIIINLHNNKILHKNINSYNFIYDESDNIIKLTGFSMSSFDFNNSFNILYNTDVDLNYISPEQSGRFNKIMDDRSDLYSLGIVLYELFTRRLPFDYIDSTELIRSHINKIPIRIDEINTSVPEQLTNIIMKLIDKNPDNRYKSAQTLEIDIKKVMKFLNKSNNKFNLYQNDYSNNFIYPKKKFEIDKDLKLILNLINEKEIKKNKILLIEGNNGTGKTNLIKEVMVYLFKSNIFYIDCNFDENKKFIPFYSILKSFRKLLQSILVENSNLIEVLKEKLDLYLGKNSKIISDLIPELINIMGEPCNLEDLPIIESENRFNYTMNRFFDVFIDSCPKFVFLLDDIEFSDASTINSIKDILLSKRYKNIIFIISYNEKKLNESIIKSDLLDIFNNNKLNIKRIKITNISVDSIKEILKFVVNLENDKYDFISSIIYEKTKGNPSEVKKFIKLLYEKNLLNNKKLDEEINIEKIESFKVFDSNYNNLINRFSNLNIRLKKILFIASCVGSEFDLDLIFQLNLNENINDEINTLCENMFLKREFITKENNKNFVNNLIFKFYNFEFHKFVYSKINNSFKYEYHYKIGKYFSKMKSLSDDMFFSMVNHLNIGYEVINNDNEIIELVFLNLKAASKSRLIGSYDEAIKYINFGISLLLAQKWTIYYQLTYKLYFEKIKIEYLFNGYNAAKKSIDFLLMNTKSDIDKIKIYNLMIIFLTNSGKHIEAVKKGLEIIDKFKIKIDLNPKKTYILYCFIKLKYKLAKLDLKDFNTVHILKDEKLLLILEIMKSLAPSAYLYNENLFICIIYKMLDITIENGFSEDSAFAFCTLGLSFIVGFKDYKNGLKYGDFGLEMIDKCNNNYLKSQCYFSYGWLNNHWLNHAKTSLNYYTMSIDIGIESGNFIYAAYSIGGFLLTNIFIGENLANLNSICQKYTDILINMRNKNMSIIGLCIIIKKVILNLNGESDDFLSLKFNDIEEEEYISGKYCDSIQEYYFFKIMLLFIFEEYEKVIYIFNESESNFNKAGVLYESDYLVYYVLSVLSFYKNNSKKLPKKVLKKIRGILKRLSEWSVLCKSNFEHKYLLILAEINIFENNICKGIELFNKSIELAEINGYINDLAIINERLGRTYLNVNNKFLAKTYYKESQKNYTKWGAIVKVLKIGEFYIDKNLLIDKKDSFEYGVGINFSIENVLKSMQSISSEVLFKNLLKKFFEITLEISGAKNIYYISNYNNKYIIEASGKLENNMEIVIEKRKLNNNILINVVDYVVKNKKSLILDDLNRVFILKTLNTDNYKNATSIMCVPVINKEILHGIMYFENSCIKNAFDKYSLKFINLLITQLAISLENTYLYQESLNREMELEEYRKNLEEIVDNRTKKLSETIINLKLTQESLIESEKMAFLGQLITSVAHEINTPLAAIKASIGSNINNFKYISEHLNDLFEILPVSYVTLFFDIINSSLNYNFVLSSKEEREKKEVIELQLKKHNVNSDIRIISNILVDIKFYDVEKILPLLNLEDSISLLKIAYHFSMFMKNNSICDISINKMSKILFALNNYSRNNKFSEESGINIIDTIETVLILYQNQVKNSVNIVKNYTEISKIKCYPDELAQVWINLISNSLHAMNSNGTLKIGVFENNKNVIVEISDTGCGIPEEIKNDIFKPFTTTKPSGEGTGLGLNIVKNIIEKHNGDITFFTRNKITTFVVKLPK